MTTRRGFLTDPDGKRSVTRLTILCLALDASALVGTLCVYLLRGHPDAAVVGAVAAVLGALIAQGIVALRGRTTAPRPDPANPGAPHA